VDSQQSDEGKRYTGRYEAVNAMLLNEFLNEHKKVEEQAKTIDEQRRTSNACAGISMRSVNWGNIVLINGQYSVIRSAFAVGAIRAQSSFATTSISEQTERTG